MSSRAYVDWQERLLQRDSARRNAVNYGMGRREYPIQSMAHNAYTERQVRRRERPRMVFNTTPRGGGSFYDEFVRQEVTRMAEDTTGREPEQTTDGMDAMRYTAQMHRARHQVERGANPTESLRGIRLPEGITPQDALTAVLGGEPQRTVQPPVPPEINMEAPIVEADETQPDEATDQPAEAIAQEFIVDYGAGRTRRRPQPQQVRTGRVRNTTHNWRHAFRRDEPDMREVNFYEVLERANELTILAGEDGIYYATWQTHDNLYGSADDSVLNTLFHKVLNKVEEDRNKVAENNEECIEEEYIQLGA